MQSESQSNDEANLCVVENKYECSKCKKILTSSNTLQKHLEKCNGVIDTQCPVCLKVFKDMFVKHSHTRRLSCESPSSTNSTIATDTYTDTTLTLFGQENLSYLLDDSNIVQRVEEYGKKGTYGLADIVEEIYCNKEQPQNNTIIKQGSRVFIKGNDFANNTTWEYREFEDIRSNMIDTISNYLNIYNQVKTSRNIVSIDRKARNSITNWCYIILSCKCGISSDLYVEQGIDEKIFNDKDDYDKDVANFIKAAQTKFIKATMIKINDFSSKHVKKQKGQYILTYTS